MAKEKLEDFTTEQLKKRRKFASFIVGILIGLFIVSMTIAVLESLDIGEWGNSSTLVPGLACLVVAIPMVVSFKKISKELEKRKIE
jgi:membrane protein CcdC involved in cytochrome C biogenesis